MGGGTGRARVSGYVWTRGRDDMNDSECDIRGGREIYNILECGEVITRGDWRRFGRRQ